MRVRLGSLVLLAAIGCGLGCSSSNNPTPNGGACEMREECASGQCCFDPRADTLICLELCQQCRNDSECSFLEACCIAPGDTFGVCQLTCEPRVDAGADASTPIDSGTPLVDDAGTTDGGPLVITPPGDPIPTATRPDRARRVVGGRVAMRVPILSDVPTLAIPGAGEVVIHELVSGAVVHRYSTIATPYATELLVGGGFERLVTVGAEGANANTCTASGISAFAQLLYPSSPPNVTDISPIGALGVAENAILTDNTNGRIERLYYDATGGLLLLDRAVDLASSATGGRAVSAEAPVGESPVLVAVDGTPGELRWVDWSAAPATVVSLGDLGNSPRVLGCAPDGRVCFVPNFASGTVTVVDTSTSPPTIAETATVGDGPISVDVADLDGTSVGVTTGFRDDTLHYLVRESGSVRVVSETLTNCGSPGHAVIIPELRWVAVTCNADDTYVLRAIPSSVP